MLYQLTPAASLELVLFHIFLGAANETTLINISRGIHFAFGNVMLYQLTPAASLELVL